MQPSSTSLRSLPSSCIQSGVREGSALPCSATRLRLPKAWLNYGGFLADSDQGNVWQFARAREGDDSLQTRKCLRPELASRLRGKAHARAADEARRIPWQVLLEARKQYLEWQEFYHWARSIMDCEHSTPDWLARKLDQVCPGFLEAEAQYLSQHPKEAPLTPVRLGQWIDDRVFGFAKDGGWLLAITFYAVRESRYQKASTCWSESVKKWQKAKPARYPSFDEWRRQAAECDETARLLPAIRKQRACFKLVDPERLAQAVSRFIDWQALARWARPALEAHVPLPSEVRGELNSRCPGFLEFRAKESATGARLPRNWKLLMLWIGEHFFEDAAREGWYDAILISVRNHPRAIRTLEYSDHCDDLWNSHWPVPYPSLEDWRRDADHYMDLGSP